MASKKTSYRSRWRADGKELFWAASAARSHTTARGLFLVELSFSGNGVQAAAPKPVFPPHVGVASLVDNRSHWTVAPDGQRFLLRQTDGPAGPAVKLILNWREHLNPQ